MKQLDASFFKISTLKLPVAAGDLLVAEPFLDDEYFGRSVISVIDHDYAEGTTGVVLNHAIETPLAEVLDGITRPEPVTLYCGGPLGHDSLFFIHTLGDSIIPEARQYGNGLWIGGNFKSAIDYINQGYPIEGYIRFFIGYSGWTVGQLDEELNDDTWAVIPEPPQTNSILQGSGDHYWHRCVRTLGEAFKPWQLLPQSTQAN